jgi:Na+/glutamate symporter
MQCLDDSPGRDVPGAAIDDMELPAALFVTGLRVGVIIDDLDRSLGILELHLHVVALVSNVLLAFLLVGR